MSTRNVGPKVIQTAQNMRDVVSSDIGDEFVLNEGTKHIVIPFGINRQESAKPR